MGKYLTDSFNTGKKIRENWELFSFELENTTPDQSECSVMYTFNWTFDDQFGYINIIVKSNKISNSSLIYTDEQSVHRFGRPLGLYNDSTLEQVFSEMMTTVGVPILGVYSEQY